MRRLYRIREVDGEDEEILDTLIDLHRLTFFESAPLPPFDWGHWWLAFHGDAAVGFAGLVPSSTPTMLDIFVGSALPGATAEIHCNFGSCARLNCERNGTAGPRLSRTRPTMWCRPTISSGPAISSTVPDSPGVGLTRYIGASRSGALNVIEKMVCSTRFRI